MCYSVSTNRLDLPKSVVIFIGDSVTVVSVFFFLRRPSTPSSMSSSQEIPRAHHKKTLCVPASPKVQKIEELERQNAGLEQDLELLRSSELLG